MKINKEDKNKKGFLSTSTTLATIGLVVVAEIFKSSISWAWGKGLDYFWKKRKKESDIEENDIDENKLKD